MTRDLILKTAMQQYATYGIKGVSMNEIAHSLHISKRTLYCNFKNKEELIMESVRSETNKLRELLEQYVVESSTALEALLRFKQETRYRNLCLCPAFRRDLPSFPHAYSKFMDFRNELHQRSKELLEQAVEEEMLIKDQNYDLIARLYAEETESAPTQYEIVLTLLRGSSTAKGKVWIDNFYYKN